MYPLDGEPKEELLLRDAGQVPDPAVGEDAGDVVVEVELVLELRVAGDGEGDGETARFDVDREVGDSLGDYPRGEAALAEVIVEGRIREGGGGVEEESGDDDDDDEEQISTNSSH